VEESQSGERKGSPRVKPICREQMVWRPVEVERLVGEEHEVRAIWEMVGEQDLKGYYREIESVEGCCFSH
jgi:hypothetical protein